MNDLGTDISGCFRKINIDYISSSFLGQSFLAESGKIKFLVLSIDFTSIKQEKKFFFSFFNQA
jgi:hypothetical protein